MHRAPLLLLAGLSVLTAHAQPGPRPPGGSATHVLLTPAGAEAITAALRAADDERVAAMVAADRARLDAILSEGLHYAHSSGRVETKAAFLESLTSRRTVYQAFDYRKRDFLIAAEDIVLMTGRALVRVGGQAAELDLNFLAAWRREAGRWRFLAWQSSRNPPPAPPSPPPPPAPSPR